MASEAAEDRSDESRTRHIDVPLGKRVRRLREEAGLTQVQVCQALGISSNQWSRHESGKNRIPAARLWQFCHLVGADVRALFGELPHSVGPLADIVGMAEETTPFQHDDATQDRDISALVAAARKLPPASRRLLLAIVRVIGEDARKPL